jgi:hypothetical protein
MWNLVCLSKNLGLYSYESNNWRDLSTRMTLFDFCFYKDIFNCPTEKRHGEVIKKLGMKVDRRMWMDDDDLNICGSSESDERWMLSK